MENAGTLDTIKCLTEIPVTDGNFKSALKRATDNQIRIAIDTMKSRDSKDKGRITACERELKKKK